MDAALRHLKKDPVMRKVIATAPRPDFPRNGTAFHSLTLAIISQQISWAAAMSIHKRLCALYGREPSPRQILATDIRTLRRAGLSHQKASYLKSLARYSLTERDFSRMTDADVIASLTGVRGVGRWTAEMFLIFSLGRKDVFPVDDLGIRRGISKLYRLREPVTVEKLERIAERWRPYRSVASWYVWHNKDNR